MSLTCHPQLHRVQNPRISDSAALTLPVLSLLTGVSGAEEAGENNSTSCLPQVVQGSSNTTETGDHELPGKNPSEYGK